MAKCNSCGRVIVFGGVKDGARRFCGSICKNQFSFQAASAQLPDAFVLEKAAELHGGPCPKCKRPGPVDLHKYYTVWSAVVLTRWSDKAELCCRPCGRQAQIRAAAFSGLFGWWGFPWGFIVTPAQLLRNLGGMLRSGNPSRPSDELVEIVRKNLSAQLIQESAERQPSQKLRASA
jgi:hypothetical protein